MNSHQVILHLTLIERVSPSVISQIITHTFASWHDVYDYSIRDLQHTIGLNEIAAIRIHAGLKNKQLLENELSLIEKHNVSWTSILDGSYPQLLKHIHLPPPILYWLGASISENKKIAIVGSRKANAYGQRMIESLVAPLLHHGFEIVSGGASGADTMAHRATVEAKNRTVAVLGSGLMHLYPTENKKLFAQIREQGGTIVSIFPMDMRPFQHNFPARNRVISGLSDGCVVIQAAEKSGARITAQFALEQGRNVFAVPGPVDDELSAGCHALIRDGATLVRNVNDILQEFGIETETGQMTITDNPTTTLPRSFEVLAKLHNFTPHQQTIIQSCAQPTSIDELAMQTQLSLQELQTILFDLQLEGHVQQDFMGMWKKQ